MFMRIRYRDLALLGIAVLLICGYMAERWLAGVTTAPVDQPIEQVKTEYKVIALTINVDWGEENIPAMLAELDKAGAKVTFFLTGRWAKNHPELVQAMAAAGHELENHGYSHPHPDQLSVEQNKQELRKTESIIQGISGYQTRYYAPPYGERGISGLRAAEELGYKTILWTLDTIDWRTDSTAQLISERVLHPEARFGKTPNHRGAIVLMHPKENTVKALPQILSHLHNEGFEFVTIEQLITLNLSGNTTL